MIELKKDTLFIDNVYANRYNTPYGIEECLVIEWECNLGFGVYTLSFDHGKNNGDDMDEDNYELTEITADSEGIDKGKDKEFLKALMEKLIDMVEVQG